MTTRHASLAEGLLAYRSRPEGPVRPAKTNWSVVPSKDNADPEEISDFGFERHLRITPSVKEIMRQVEEGQVERNEAGQIIKIGALRFSDGNQTERACCYGPEGKLIQYDATMPVGSMLGSRDKMDGELGGGGLSQSDAISSNYYFSDILRTDYPRYLKAGERTNGPGYNLEERKAMLAQAYANTPVLPSVTYGPPAMPCGSARPTDSFVGMRKGKKGESGAIAWEDIASSKVNKEIWDETLASLSKRDTAALDAAMTAQTLGDIEPGGHDKAASRRGKRALMAANDNLLAAIAKSAA